MNENIIEPNEKSDLYGKVQPGCWPTEKEKNKLSSPFGWRLKASENYRIDFHRGIDIPGDEGIDMVYAIADGEVIQAFEDGDVNNPYKNGGTTLIIKHKFHEPIVFRRKECNNYYSVYMHLYRISEEIMEKKNKKVKRGEYVAILGKSGTTVFPHLHFEIRIGGICSIEYQRSHPESKCSKDLGFDPHVNPLGFLEKNPNNCSLEVLVIDNDPLKIQVMSPRDKLYFNIIEITNGSNQVRRIDFNKRVGINENDIDNNYVNGVKAFPRKFNANTNEYCILFEIPAWSNVGSIMVGDIWGNTLEQHIT